MEKFSIFILFILCFSFVHAEFLVVNTNFKDSYNLGEIITVNFTLEKDSSSDYLQAYLVCDSEEDLIYKRLLGSTLKQNIEFSSLADKKGNCLVKLSYKNIQSTSEKFNISNKLKITGSLNNKFFYPSEYLTINLSVEDLGQNSVDGQAKITLGGILLQSTEVKTGRLFFQEKIANNLAPGEYELEVLVTQVRESFKNEEKFVEKITILPKATSLYLVTNESLSLPGENFFYLDLQDQVGKSLKNETILVKIFDPLGNIFYQTTTLSANNFSLYFPDSSTKGAWKFSAFYGSLFNSKQFYILENKKINIFASNNSNNIKIKNTGNTLFEGIALINFSNSTTNLSVPLNITLAPGEEFNYFPELIGEYNISQGTDFQSNVFLTGAVISPTNNLLGKKSLYSLVIFFIILVILSLSYFGLRRLKLNFKSRGAIEDRKLNFIYLESNDYTILEKVFNSKGFRVHLLENGAFIAFLSSTTKNFSQEILTVIQDLKKQKINLNLAIYSQLYTGNNAVNKASLEICKAILRSNKGIFANQDFIRQLKNSSIDFNFYSALRVGEKVINLYKLK